MLKYLLKFWGSKFFHFTSITDKLFSSKLMYYSKVFGILRTALEWQKWRMAERYIIKAFKLDSDCLMVVSTMGSVRRSGGQKQFAVHFYKKVVLLGSMALRLKKTTDIKLVMELVNDARFDLYRLYYSDNHRLSKLYLNYYKKGLRKGAPTIYKPLKKFLLD